MIRNYLRRSMLRNKIRSLLIMVGIVVSIMLVSGVNIASNRMALSMIQDRLDEVKVDFTFRSYDDNITANLAKIDSLSEELDEYLATYAIGQASYEMGVYMPNEANFNWTGFLEPDYYRKWNYYNTSYFVGMANNVFAMEEIEQRFENVISFNTPLNLSSEGLYIESGFANDFDLEQGDTFTINLIVYESEYNIVAEEYTENYYRVNISNIPILGIMNIPNEEEFGQFIGERYGYYPDDTRFFLGNISYVENLIEDFSQKMSDVITVDMYQQDPWNMAGSPFELRYGVLLDHTAITNLQAAGMSERIDYIETRITRVGDSDFYNIYTGLSNIIQVVQLEILLYQTLFLIVSLPVLILGWYLCKTNWLLSYQQRRREFALLKIKGGVSSQLKSMFFLEAIIVGALGGLLGIFGGNLTSSLVLSRIYPQALEGQSFGVMLGQIFSGEFMKWSTWVLGLIGGIIMSILAVRKPLQEYSKMEPIDGLAKYHESSHKQLPKKKRDVVFLIIGAFPILVSLSSELIMNIGGFGAYIILGPLIGISTALLPFAPFILTYALVKLLCRNMSFFQKIIAQISKMFSKSISVFTSKSIVNNQARSFRLVFIVAMALSFLVLASTVEGSELDFQVQRDTIRTGGGLRYGFYSPTLATRGIENLTKSILNDSDQYHVEAINWFGNLYDSGIKGQSGGDYYEDEPYIYYGSAQVYLFSAENYTNYMSLHEKWFHSEFGVEVISKLAEGKTCLIPVSMVDQGYIVGENLTIQYQSSNTSMTERAEMELEIIGSYEVFPLGDEYGWDQQVIVANNTIQDGVMRQVSLVMYPEAGTAITDLDENVILNGLKDWDTLGGYAYLYYDRASDTDDITGSLLRFLNLESIYLLTIVTFGIAIIMYISINEKSHDMGLLRARGVDKRVLYKIQFAEGTTLILLGAIFTFTGIIGGASIIMQLNNINLMGSSGGIQRSVLIPWGKLALELLGSMAAFLLSIVIAVAIETRKSDVTKIGDLLRVAS